MMTDPKTRAYLQDGDEWVELPATIDGRCTVYHIPPMLVQAGDSHTIRIDASLFHFTPFQLPDGAIINKAELVIDRARPVADEEE